jgi:hypothetical protein
MNENYTFYPKSIILLAGIMLQYHSEIHLRSPTQHDTAIYKIGHPDPPHLSWREHAIQKGAVTRDEQAHPCQEE